MESFEENSVAIIGAGLYGLVTAKVLLHESNSAFPSVTVFEKQSDLGGVWSQERIYPGLASNSPTLTYEIPGFQYPEKLRKAGSHVEASDVNAYLRAFSDRYHLEKHIKFNSEVTDISWDPKSQRWSIHGFDSGGMFGAKFRYLVVCNGLYHSRNFPAVVNCADGPTPNILHSADVGVPEIRNTLTSSKHTLVVGAGKSAIDLATMLASGNWSTGTEASPQVTLLYQRPHWLSPRAIMGGVIYFERILFSRFLNAWLPFANHPDSLHSWIAESAIGKWLTSKIFQCVEMDFKLSCGQQDMPETIPQHPIREALSGALHVVPKGYFEYVRAKSIRIIKGSITDINETEVIVQSDNGETITLEPDHALFATGYRIAFPFFSTGTLQQLGIQSQDSTCDPNDVPYLKFYRLLVPPITTQEHIEKPIPCRNIAFNGFAYSLLNPTVAFISAHWIADYFQGNLDLPDAQTVSADVERFYKWQSDTFAKHGQKGVHIGSHATLYTDMLLSDMNVNTGHVEGWRTNPARFLKEWFRPMYPQIYANLGQDKRKRSGSSTSLLRPTRKANSRGWNLLWTNTFIGLSISLLWAVTTDSLRQLSE